MIIGYNWHLCQDSIIAFQRLNFYNLTYFMMNKTLFWYNVQNIILLQYPNSNYNQDSDFSASNKFEEDATSDIYFMEQYKLNLIKLCQLRVFLTEQLHFKVESAAMHQKQWVFIKMKILLRHTVRTDHFYCCFSIFLSLVSEDN